MDPQDLLLTALRASLIYFFLLLVIRLLGKRAVGRGSAFDLIVALMLGEVVDEAIYGDVSIIKSLVAISIIAVWHFINAWASYRSKTVEKITAAEPTVLVENGEFVRAALAKERINEEEVFSELRLLEVEDLREVRKATLEPSGKISVTRQPWARELQKGDLEKAQQDLSG